MGTALAAVVSVSKIISLEKKAPVLVFKTYSFYLDHQSSTRAKVYSFYFVADARKE